MKVMMCVLTFCIALNREIASAQDHYAALDQVKQQIVELEVQRESLLERTGAGHPQTKAVETRLKHLQQDLAQMKPDLASKTKDLFNQISRKAHELSELYGKLEHTGSAESELGEAIDHLNAAIRRFQASTELADHARLTFYGDLKRAKDPQAMFDDMAAKARDQQVQAQTQRHQA